MSQVAEQSTLATAFEAFRLQPSFGAGGLGPAREAAFSRFLAAGFPTTRDEEWRHTNIGPIARTEFAYPAAFDLAPAAAEPFLFADDLPHRVVLVNGRWSAELSSLGALPEGVDDPEPSRCGRDAIGAEPQRARLARCRVGRHAVRRSEHGVCRGRRRDRHRAEDRGAGSDPHRVPVLAGVDADFGHAADSDPRGRAVAGIHRRKLRQRGGGGLVHECA